MTSTWTDRGLFVLRLALGVVFVMHGWQKLAVFGHAGVTGFLTQLGVPFPGVNAVLITAVEIGGGVLLLAGAFTRIASTLLAFAMLVAVVTAHLANGFFAPTGFEYPLTLLLASAALTMTGAGAYSVDRLMAGRQVATSDVRPMVRRAA